MVERIGIFGGAFNPVHNGHLSVASSFLESNLIHSLWLIPTADPPHKTDSLAPFRHRLKMLEIAFYDWDRIEINDLESRLENPSYTLRTVTHLQDSYDDRLFYLCMGEDSLSRFSGWYKYEELLQRACLLVAERPGYDKRAVPEKILNRTIFVEHEPVDISSTDIRKTNTGGDESGADTGKKLPDSIHQYIAANALYKDQFTTR
ncbi:MAG: nicotinate (nicotinamide) nucleotide adenylyltransferase [Balneolaceae bacterium]